MSAIVAEEFVGLLGKLGQAVRRDHAVAVCPKHAFPHLMLLQRGQGQGSGRIKAGIPVPKLGHPVGPVQDAGPWPRRDAAAALILGKSLFERARRTLTCGEHDGSPVQRICQHHRQASSPVKKGEHPSSVNWGVTRLRALLTVAFALFTALAFPGCRQGTPEAGQASSATQQQGKRYPLHGRVMGVNLASSEVELDAAAIPGYMDAMTMPYKLKDPAVLGELHAGDMLRAALVVTDTSAVLDEIVITGQSRPVAKPTTNLRPLVPGAIVPNFALINQSGSTVHLDQYRGRVLVLTFVYTRCPLADYCPRMSRNFAEVDKAMAADPRLYAGTHLLSVSFDPKYDTPAVLRSYGGAYTGKYTKETFEHWEFAAPFEKELTAVLTFFDVAATPEANKTVTHSLSTVVIGTDGKVYKWYPTNEWKPSDIVADAKALLGARA